MNHYKIYLISYKTALHIACENNNFEIVKQLLLFKGINTKLKDNVSLTSNNDSISHSRKEAIDVCTNQEIKKLFQ